MKRRQATAQVSLPFPTDCREVYRDIRNYLAGRLVGATRDEFLVEEVIKCIFCNAHIHRRRAKQERGSVESTAERYAVAYGDLVKILPALFPPKSSIGLDPTSLAYVDTQLGRLDLDNPQSDPIGDAYETFIGSSVRGNEGQFFTPHGAVALLISLVDPKAGESIIDPACGAGSFLSHTARHLLAKGRAREEVAGQLYGIDKIDTSRSSHFLT